MDATLTIDEHQNSIRGGTKQAKKISDSRHILGGAIVSRYWIYVYDKKTIEKYFWQSGRDAEDRQTGGTAQRSAARNGQASESLPYFGCRGVLPRKSDEGRLLRGS
jgi:hypothetical protein